MDNIELYHVYIVFIDSTGSNYIMFVHNSTNNTFNKEFIENQTVDNKP